MARGFISCTCAISIENFPTESLLTFRPNAEMAVLSGCRNIANTIVAIAGHATACKKAGTSIGWMLMAAPQSFLSSGPPLGSVFLIL
jgi:hypothetical protein